MDYNKILKEIIKNIKNENNNKYERNIFLLTPTEYRFYLILKKITDEMNLNVFIQVSLLQIIKGLDKESINKLINKSIDFVITEKNSKIICCIELDDYTHNRQDRKKRDIFVNRLFEENKIQLLRIPVTENYNTNQIKNALTAT